MRFAWDEGVMPTGTFVFSTVVIALVICALFVLYFKVIKRKVAYIVLSLSSSLFILGFLFVSTPVMILAGSVMAFSVTTTLFANLGDLRKFLANPFKKSGIKTSTYKVEKLFDKDSMYKEIEKATINLSKTRTGAIMTFERNTSLQDVMKNGVPVNAPVRAELLETIFYQGTRLHDGAVIIHGNEIVAASVFFTPTTQAFAGKYGSRHRAAIGISEISDAVTVVVSEETGRISLAVNGQLVSCEPATFLRVFETHMDLNKAKE
ncbi:MAG: TIGR00159 family protein [Erysipelotrichaceae bacterium]|nr:TIGR00159 family protein [Erysipelotrichaceae bacterium]